MNDYKTTVRSAGTALPIAVEMEELFPVADQFITHYGFDSGAKPWNTEVFFGGRYTLTMQVDVEIDYKANKISAEVGEPTFYLKESETIVILRNGCAETTYRGPKHRRFGADEWRKLYQAKGDFSVIGIKIDPEPVKHFDACVSQWRRPRVQVSLLDK